MSMRPTKPTPRRAACWPTSVLPGLSSITALCADAGYRGTFVEHLQTRWKKADHISTKIKGGFAVILKRWIVERSLGGFNGQRR